jgi:hypothetical protein
MDKEASKRVLQKEVAKMCAPCRFFQKSSGKCSVNWIANLDQLARVQAGSCEEAEVVEKGLVVKKERLKVLGVWITKNFRGKLK